MSVLMLFSFATFHNDHISKVISDARAFSRCQFLKILLMGRPHRRRFGRDLVRFQGRAAAACAPAVSCWVCCCFAEGLWEVLALWGQLRTPPSSCSDRHQALTQTFSLFHFISGLSNGPQMGPEAPKHGCFKESKVSKSHSPVLVIFIYFNRRTCGFSSIYFLIAD